MLKYFMTFMTGSSIGLIAGYIAGSKRNTYLDFKSPDSLKKEEGSSNAGIKNDLNGLKENYDKKLNELTDQVKDRVRELKRITQESE